MSPFHLAQSTGVGPVDHFTLVFSSQFMRVILQNSGYFFAADMEMEMFSKPLCCHIDGYANLARPTSSQFPSSQR